MRKIATYLSAIVLLTACITNNRQNNRILYVSIQPLQSLVDSIVGGDFEVEVLVPAGASPETFEPTPRQFVELNEAQLIFNVGLIDFETSLLGKVEQQEKVIDLSHGIDLIEGSCSHSSHGHNHTHGVDPHVWTSPKALQKMATNAFEAIRKAYPDSVKYETNYNRLQVAIETDGKEPSAKQLTAIIRQAREDGVRRIFYQKQFPASTVEVIARDIDAEYVAIDPLDRDAIANIDTITDLITAK